MVDAETITIDSFQRKFGLQSIEAEETSRQSPEGRGSSVQQQYSFVQRRPDSQAKKGPTRLEIRAGDITTGQPAFEGPTRPAVATVKSSGGQVRKEGGTTRLDVKDEKKDEEDYSRKPLPASPQPPKISTDRSGRDQPVIESAVIATSEDEDQLLPPSIRRVPRPPVRRRPKSTPGGMTTTRSRSSPGLNKDTSR